MVLVPPRPLHEREWVALMWRLARRRTALFGLIVVAIVLLTAVFANVVSPFDPLEQDISQRLKEPGWVDGKGRAHPLGTDHLGRDILARIIYGSRIALSVGLAAVAVSGVLGMTIGLVAGYFGGRVDDFFMRLADVQLAFPFILLAIAVIGVLGASLQNIIIVIGVSSWVVYARVVRGEVLSIREREYVQAAIALGSRDWRILARHVLPNTFTPWLVVATLDMARVIVIEAALSFLGLGVQPPDADVGRHAGRRARVPLHRVVARHLPRASRSSSPSSASTCSATGSATRWTRGSRSDGARGPGRRPADRRHRGRAGARARRRRRGRADRGRGRRGRAAARPARRPGRRHAPAGPHQLSRAPLLRRGGGPGPARCARSRSPSPPSRRWSARASARWPA